MRAVVAISGAVVAAACAGCSTSPWESEFRAAGGSVNSLPPNAPVRLREVEWERVQRTLSEISAERAASDSHPDDWPQEKRDAELARLLRGLQVQGTPATVRLLGRSDFRSTGRVRPEDGALAEFARRIGATTVAWTSTYLGKADSVRQEAVTEYRSGTVDRWNSVERSRRPASYTEASTVYVPVVVRADEYAFAAFFLREE
jgi:hypothetical protein